MGPSAKGARTTAQMNQAKGTPTVEGTMLDNGATMGKGSFSVLGCRAKVMGSQRREMRERGEAEKVVHDEEFEGMQGFQERE